MTLRIGSKVFEAYIEDNVFKLEGLDSEGWHFYKDSIRPYNNYDVHRRKSNLYLKLRDVNDLEISENKFSGSYQHTFTGISTQVNNLIISDNVFESSLALELMKIESQLEILRNQFSQSVAFSNVVFPENYNMISWQQFQGRKLGFYEDIPADFIYYGFDVGLGYLFKATSDSEMSNQEGYDRLISIYYELFTIFKGNGNIESSNGCYAEMKDIEGRRLKYIYDLEGGFRNYFRWKLNRLLKFYTNHGPDPALAILISMYVVLGFGVFYFFFPSEWDITSKSKLIRDFKDFTQKNDKGYLRPLLSLIIGFVISLINALTLSQNSFTTLGFGQIPTTGLARYVCIIQGFIGWFLLSIFTVAIINQVLA